MVKLNIDAMDESSTKTLMYILEHWMYMHSIHEISDKALQGYKEKLCKDFLHVNNKYYYKDSNIGFIFIEEDEKYLPIEIDKVTDEQELNLLSMIY